MEGARVTVHSANLAPMDSESVPIRENSVAETRPARAPAAIRRRCSQVSDASRARNARNVRPGSLVERFAACEH